MALFKIPYSICRAIVDFIKKILKYLSKQTLMPSCIIRSQIFLGN